MIFKNLDDFKVRFYFDEQDKNSWVELLFITDEMTALAHKKYIKNVVEYQVNPKSERLERLPFRDADTEALRDWSVTTGISDWSGLQWEDGTEIPCTDENKLKLYLNQPAFKEFADESWIKLREMAKEKFGGGSEEKNSLSM